MVGAAATDSVEVAAGVGMGLVGAAAADSVGAGMDLVGAAAADSVGAAAADLVVFQQGVVRGSASVETGKVK